MADIAANDFHAFPTSSIDGFTQHGMTLRDYFAATVIGGLCAGPNAVNYARVNAISGSETPHQTLARIAYEQADAMLKARES